MPSLTNSSSESRRSRSPPSSTSLQEGPAAQLRSGPFPCPSQWSSRSRPGIRARRWSSPSRPSAPTSGRPPRAPRHVAAHPAEAGARSTIRRLPQPAPRTTTGAPAGGRARRDPVRRRPDVRPVVRPVHRAASRHTLWKRAHVLPSAGFHSLRREPRPVRPPVVEPVETRCADTRMSTRHRSSPIGACTDYPPGAGGCSPGSACQWLPVACLP